MRRWILLFCLLCACTREAKQDALPSSGPQAKSLVSGTLDMDKSLQAQADPLAILFIIARNQEGQIVAVRKLFPPFQYPLNFALTSEDTMIAGTELSGKLKLTARLDKDGNANPAQSGDILGHTKEEWSKVGEDGIKIQLDELVK